MNTILIIVMAVGIGLILYAGWVKHKYYTSCIKSLDDEMMDELKKLSIDGLREALNDHRLKSLRKRVKAEIQMREMNFS